MVVYLYSLTKRKNSLVHASGVGTEYNVTLKAQTSVLNPVLEFQEDPTSYNYAFIPDFGRYYYLGDYIWERGVWAVQCNVDVLASWSTYIRGTAAQVLFSSSNYSLDLLDNRIPASGRIIRNVVNVPFAGAKPNAQTVPQGYFALTALDGIGLWATGAATTYFMTYQQMQTFASELLNPDTWQAIKQFFDNPMEAIVDCYYLPIDVSQYVDLTTDRNLRIGDYTFNAIGKSAQATNMANKSKSATIEIDWAYDDFRRLSPYTKLEMFVPFCGAETIAPESCYQQEAILMNYSVDVSTGAVEAVAYIKETILAEFSGNCRVQLPIGQSQARVDAILGSAGGIIAAMGGVASGNVALGASGLLSAIGSAISPTVQKTMGGMNGSILGAILGNEVMRWQQIRLSVTSHETVATPDSIRSTIGNVNGDVLSLSGLTGYCQTAGASVAAPCTDTELEMINSYLDGGVYL